MNNLDSWISITSQEQKTGGKKETDRSEAACSLRRGGEKQKDQAFPLWEPMDDRVYEMLLSTGLKAETVAGTASSKKHRRKKEETEQKKNHWKKTDTGLRNRRITQGFS